MWNRLRYTLWAPADDAIARLAGFDARDVCRLTGCGSLRATLS